MPHRTLQLSAACALAFASLACAAAQPWRADLPQATMTGAGEYRLFGVRIYDASLWSERQPVTMDSPFALQLTYAREISARQLADTSVDEMRRMGAASSDATLEAWRAELQRVLVDVRAGDRLSGVYLPGQGARFYANDRPSGQIADPILARAFFAIWLDPGTRAPGLRARLLGQAR